MRTREEIFEQRRIESEFERTELGGMFVKYERALERAWLKEGQSYYGMSDKDDKELRALREKLVSKLRPLAHAKGPSSDD